MRILIYFINEDIQEKFVLQETSPPFLQGKSLCFLMYNIFVKQDMNISSEIRLKTGPFAESLWCAAFVFRAQLLTQLPTVGGSKGGNRRRAQGGQQAAAHEPR